MKKDYKIDIELYSMDNIKQAISDFSEVSEILLKNSVISISWKDENEINEIFNELLNYIISLEC